VNPRERLAALPQAQLTFGDTPLQETPRLAEAIGLDRLWVKRDDNTGLALGGNKARKLDFVIGDALAQGADTVITIGAAQSNHCRMTSAAAARCGLACRLVFIGEPVEEVQGNLLLDRLLGAEWDFVAPGETLYECVERVRRGLEAAGRRPYVIPIGATNDLGVLGYVRAAFELADQLAEPPAYVFVSAGSLGTAAGLGLGLALEGVDTDVVGVRPSHPGTDLQLPTLDGLIAGGAALLGVEPPPHRVRVLDGYVGEGYGRPTELSTRALELAARLEGIILDPVYTAKAFAGLIGEVEAGRVRRSDPVVFVHTGGMPALFADRDLYWPPAAHVGSQTDG
jgi:D-cysteine desulfhydrase family pyridoxal phosphate-dependent enzyme